MEADPQMENIQKTINYETTDFENSFQLIHKITTRRFQYGNHIHTCFYEVNILIRGNLEFEIEDMRKHLEPGDVTVVAPGEIHRLYINDNSEYERLVLHISEYMLQELSTPKTNLGNSFKQIRAHFIHFTQEELERFIEISKRINRYLEDASLFGSDILTQSYLNLLLIEIVGKMQEAGQEQTYCAEFTPLIRETLEYMKEHLTEDISVASIAEHLNVSRSYLSRVFKESTGYSLWNYVVSRRLNLSQKLIMEGRSVTEACYESGFRDYAHFIKTFSRTFQVSPMKYKHQSIHRITVNLKV